MITILLIVAISILSIICFHKKKIYSGLIFNPYKQYQVYRFISYAFIHSNYIHLISNVVIFFIFGSIAEKFLSVTLYLIFIFLSIFFAVLPYTKKKFKIIGLSGCNSAIIFFCVLHYPVIFFVSSPYLLYCWYSDRNSNDLIAHASHLWGSIFAFFFTLLFFPELIFNIFVP